MNAIQITKSQLVSALAHWEQEARDGKMMTNAEKDVLPVADVAAASAEYLWAQLQGAAA